MPAPSKKHVFIFLVPVILVVFGYLLFGRGDGPGRGDRGERVAAVEVDSVERRSLKLQRTFSGALEAESRVVVAPKVGGRIERMEVDLADQVDRGQVVAYLDDAEFAQAVIQAEAQLAVANATLAQAESALEISRRENRRVVELRETGISSDSEFDLALADLLEKEARVKVAEAQVSQATAALEAARIRFGYTRVTADWPEGDATRMVAERYMDEGETVAANESLMQIVRLDPIVAVISVTERDYGRLHAGQTAQFRTDAFPGEIFEGRIERIAPVFRQESRQARVELSLPNPDGRLKPGMFIRASITLDQVDDAVAVPESAITRRDDQDGVFLVSEDGSTVDWVTIEPGIRDSGWVEVLNSTLTGRVVTLGQHLIDDGSRIRITEVAELEMTP
jgi:RND family efflux transporter MFP subunit